MAADSEPESPPSLSSSCSTAPSTPTLSPSEHRARIIVREALEIAQLALDLLSNMAYEQTNGTANPSAGGSVAATAPPTATEDVSATGKGKGKAVESSSNAPGQDVAMDEDDDDDEEDEEEPVCLLSLPRHQLHNLLTELLPGYP